MKVNIGYHMWNKLGGIWWIWDGCDVVRYEMKNWRNWIDIV